MVAPLHVEKSDSNNNCGQSVRSTNIGRRWHVSVMPTFLRSYPTGWARRKEKRPNPPQFHSCHYANQLHQRWTTLARIRLANAASQLPYGSGKTKGEASQIHSTPSPTLREPAF